FRLHMAFNSLSRSVFKGYKEKDVLKLLDYGEGIGHAVYGGPDGAAPIAVLLSKYAPLSLPSPPPIMGESVADLSALAVAEAEDRERGTSGSGSQRIHKSESMRPKEGIESLGPPRESRP